MVGQIRTAGTVFATPPPAILPRAVVDIWGAGIDLQLALNDRLGFAGEFFVGQGLGDYNGGVLQSFNPNTFDPIRTMGGFGEVYFYCSPRFHMHFGYGIDDPRADDLAVTQIRRNQTYFATMLFDWSKAVQVGVEVDYRRTDYTEFTPGIFLDADSVVFGTRFLWRF